MSKERKADLDAEYAELEYEVWLAISQGATEGAHRAVIMHDGVEYGLVLRFAVLPKPQTLDDVLTDAEKL